MFKRICLGGLLMISARAWAGENLWLPSMFSNVLVGEVWLFCGQSNMMHPMNACAEREDAVARRYEFPLIRFAQVGRRGAHEIIEPQEEVQGYWGPVKWEDASYIVQRSSATDIPGSCSAIGYFFARSLSEALGNNVPVTVIEIDAILPSVPIGINHRSACTPVLRSHHILSTSGPIAAESGNDLPASRIRNRRVWQSACARRRRKV